MREVLLALLADGREHGYELKHAIESTFGDAWPPLNIGQIYTTLGRLERDGLVCSQHVPQDGRPDKRVYELTDAGRTELRGWIEAPVTAPALKDEFFTKLVLAGLPGVARLNGASDPLTLIARQRRAYLQSLRELNDLAARQTAARGQSPATPLLIERAMLHLQADLNWLDLCEQRLRSSSGSSSNGGS